MSEKGIKTVPIATRKTVELVHGEDNGTPWSWRVQWVVKSCKSGDVLKVLETVASGQTQEETAAHARSDLWVACCHLTGYGKPINPTLIPRGHKWHESHRAQTNMPS